MSHVSRARVHTVVDSIAAARAKRVARIEKQKEQLRQYIAAEEEGTRLLADDSLDPTNYLARVGRPMHERDFEAKLKKICPVLEFRWSLREPGKKDIYIPAVAGRPEGHVLTYDGGLIPERSVYTRVYEDIIDRDQISRVEGSLMHLTPDSLPKHDWGGGRIDPATGRLTGGPGWIFDDKVPKPGFKRISRMWREYIRGWRTVLLRLMKMGLVPLIDAETFFGADNTPEWAYHTGRQQTSRGI